jgi:hypothetical protein
MREPPAQKAFGSGSGSAEPKGTSAEVADHKDQHLSAAYSRIKAAFERATKP